MAGLFGPTSPDYGAITILKNPPLRILHLEDSESIAKFIQETLFAEGIDCKIVRVETREDFVARLTGGAFDIILADYTLPAFDGISALEIAKRLSPEVPFVFLSGTLGEESAIETLKSGATDYVLKDSLSRLAPSVRRALQEAEERARRKQAEDALRQTEKRLWELFDNAPVGYHELDTAGRIIRVNSTELSLLGYTREEMLGHYGWEFVDEKETARDAITANLAGISSGRGFERTYVRKDGSQIPVLMEDRLLKDEKGRITGILTTLQDLSERQQAEEALRDSEKRYRLLFEEALTGDFIAKPDGTILACNPAFARILGFSTVEEAMQYNLGSFYKDPKDREKFIELLHKEKKLEDHESVRFRKDGAPVYLIENIIGKFNAEGELVEIKGYVSDNTERKKLEQQLRQSVKMEAVGRLAGGVAHDFNNLLTLILGHSDMLLSDLAAGSPIRQDLEAIHKAALRAAELTQQLLAFSRRQVLQPKLLALNTVVVDLDKMLRRLIGEDIKLLTVLESSLGKVRADKGQIEQVIMNLAVNARDAMPPGKGGRLWIETSNAVLDENNGRVGMNAPGRYVRLAIRDTGCGMDAQTRARIFEPFFTTKEQGKGTGLGLSTVYGIVKQSGGYIYVESELGKGSTFEILLPRVDEEVPSQELQGASREASGGSETILLVEDEPAIIELAQRILQSKGYTVLVARNGDLALRIAKLHQGPINLLVTDVVMPEMSGREVAERLVPLRPKMKVLYMSGYTDDAMVHYGVLDPGVGFLPKPFTAAALAQKVRDILDAPEPPGN